MPQTEQFVLRLDTYGPDGLDDQGHLPDYQQQVTEVITPKFAADFDKDGLPIAEQSSPRPATARSAKVFATGVASIDGDSADGDRRRRASPAATPTRSTRTTRPSGRADPTCSGGGRPGPLRRPVAGRRLHAPVTERRSAPDHVSSPSWYDVLGVDPDASADEIRAAWRPRSPTSTRPTAASASLNQAAEVLLDPRAPRGVRRRAGAGAAEPEPRADDRRRDAAHRADARPRLRATRDAAGRARAGSSSASRS